VEYKKIRAAQLKESLQLLEELLTKLCTYQVSQKVLSRNQAQALQAGLETRFLTDMRNIELQCHDALKGIYQYHNLDSEIVDLPLEDNLFDTEKWIVWGLNRKRLTAAASMAGAATGAAVDLAVAGSSLMLGALSGGLIGAGSAWFGADQIARFRVKGLPLGGFEARQGPIKNRNFPYVVLGRYLYLAMALRNRTHARRDSIQIREGDLTDRIAALSGKQQSELHKALERLCRQQAVEDLKAFLKPVLEAAKT
jgi:hypothetical protein